MAFLTGKIKDGSFFSGASYLYAALLLTVLFLAVPPEGYLSISECKYIVFTALFALYAAAMAAGGAAALLLGARPDFKKMLTPVNIAAASYLLFACVSAALSPYGPAVLLGGTRHDGLFTTAAYVLSFLLLSANLRADRRLLWLLALSVTACCAVAVLQFAGRNPLGLYPEGFDYFGADGDYAGVYVGTLGNTNIGAAVLCGSAAAFAVALTRRKSRLEWLYAVPLALSVYVLVKADVSSALLAMAVFVPLSLPVVAGKKLRRAAFVAAGAIFAAALAFLWFGRFDGGFLYEASEFLHGRGLPSFGSGRLSIWSAALPAAGEHLLFGTGPDTFRFLGLNFQWVSSSGAVFDSAVTAAHNDWLNILVNTGVFSLVAYMALQAALMTKWYKSPENTVFAVAGAFALTCTVQLFFGISMPINAPFFWLALAILNSAGKTGKDMEEDGTFPPSRASYVCTTEEKPESKEELL